MALFDADQMSAILKRQYGPRIVPQISDRVEMLDLFEKDSDSWEGLEVKFPVAYGRAQSFMAHGALGLIPQPQNETTAEATVPVKWMRGRIQFSTDSLKRSMTSKAAFIKSQELLMGRFVKNAADERNRMLSAGNGGGVLCLVDGTINSTTITVDAPMGIAADDYGARYIQPGMLIGVLASGSDTLLATRAVVSVASGDGSFVVDAAGDTTSFPDDGRIVRVSNLTITNVARDTSLSNEPAGFEAIVGTSTPYLGISTATVADWVSSTISAGGLSLDVLQRLEDTIDQQYGEPITHHLMHHSVRRAYLALLDATRSFMQTGKTANYDLGFEPQGVTPTFNGKPLIAGRDMQLGKWKMVNANHLQYYSLTEGEWVDEDGSVLVRTPGQDAFEAWWRWAGNYCTDARMAHGEISGLSTTSAIARHIA